jgi:4-alpha-glucanotransferase
LPLDWDVDLDDLLGFGIEPEYTDIWGCTHVTSDEVAAAILKSLGMADLATENAIQRHREQQWSRALDPAIVIREGADSDDAQSGNAAAIVVRVPAARGGSSIKLEIRWESPASGEPGELEHHWFWLPELRTIETASIGGEEFVAKRVPLPAAARLGYHEIRLYWVEEPELECFTQARFIVCPKRVPAPQGRMAGVALSLYGLRSSRNWGIGDFTDLITVIDALAAAGADFVALNPLHAIPNRQPFNISPYLPTSSLYRNYIYLDVERIGPAKVGGSGFEADREAVFVNYERAAKLKLAILRIFHADFLEGGGAAEFDQYVAREGQALEDFAVYRALEEEMHRRNPNVWIWPDWPPEYHDPRSAAVAEFAREHGHEVSFFKFLQWHVDRQLAEVQAHALASGMRIGLYHDLALATDRYGADVWANRAFYATGARVGAPPDDFSPKGQDWAFPPPNREAHRADGYEWFARSIRNTARHGGALRIDHVMRFFRLYWIPDGMDATSGAYVRDYADNLLGILALESVRGNFLVIGEDLGTVTEEVRRTLGESGVLSYRVLWFERHGDGTFREPREYPEQAAVSTTTHDLPTLAGFAAGRDIEARREAGMIDEAAYVERIAGRVDEKRKLAEVLEKAGFNDDPIGFLLSTPCALAIVNQEDLTGEVEQQNLPGTTWQHPNWRRKMKVAVEDLGPFAERLRSAIDRTGRR